MSDPYKTLGVAPTITDEELKAAYRDLAKKYHPDNYTGSPLADLAGEKMAEINAAYDTVQQLRRNGGHPTGPQGRNYQNGGYQQGYQGGGEFDDIRRMISMGRVLEAEELLNGVAMGSRNAEWHFLKGNALYNRGFLEEALGYMQNAVNMDPQNGEYRAALNTLLNRRQYGYSNVYTSSNYGGGCSPCGICTTCMCANCMCDSCQCCC